MPHASRLPALLRSSLSFRVLALAALPLAAGCDDLDDGFDGDNEVRSVLFSFNLDDIEESGDGTVGQFFSRDLPGDAADAIEDVLTPAVVDGGVVLLYAEDDLVYGFRGEDDPIWQALPYTEAFEGELVIAGNPTPYVDFTLTYTFSYDVGDLYFDVISSAAFAEGEFAAFLEDRLQQEEIPMKLVTIPGDVYAESGLRAADLRDYETVRRAFALPE